MSTCSQPARHKIEKSEFELIARVLRVSTATYFALMMRILCAIIDTVSIRQLAFGNAELACVECERPDVAWRPLHVDTRKLVDVGMKSNRLTVSSFVMNVESDSCHCAAN